MNGRRILVAVVSVFILLLVVQLANALPKLPNANPTATQLEGYCNENGGVWFAPSASGVYACLLPDGTLIACGGVIPICTQSRTLGDGHLLGITSIILSMQLEIAKKVDDLASQVGGLLAADLVPLPTPASTPPEGFCRRNDQGQLLVNVYNQGGADAVASTTRIIFAPGGPGKFAALLSIDTPAIAASTGTDLPPIDIPNSCWDANNNCKFTIGVDLNNVVLESNETNNNAAGLCGAQFQ